MARKYFAGLTEQRDMFLSKNCPAKLISYLVLEMHTFKMKYIYLRVNLNATDLLLFFPCILK